MGAHICDIYVQEVKAEGSVKLKFKKGMEHKDWYKNNHMPILWIKCNLLVNAMCINI